VTNLDTLEESDSHQFIPIEDTNEGDSTSETTEEDKDEV